MEKTTMLHRILKSLQTDEFMYHIVIYIYIVVLFKLTCTSKTYFGYYCKESAIWNLISACLKKALRHSQNTFSWIICM